MKTHWKLTLKRKLRKIYKNKSKIKNYNLKMTTHPKNPFSIIQLKLNSDRPLRMTHISIQKNEPPLKVGNIR